MANSVLERNYIRDRERWLAKGTGPSMCYSLYIEPDGGLVVVLVSRLTT